MVHDLLKAQEIVQQSKMRSLKDLALALLKDGPCKVEETPRRVRGLFDGSYCFDTTRAHYIWEFPYYPAFYIPVQDVKAPSLARIEPVDNDKSAFLCQLKGTSKSTDQVIWFEKGLLAGLIRFEFGALDAWFEEEQRIYGHPKDPYKRIDILPSSRKITAKLDGRVIAESSNNMFLYETMLRPRYYMPLSSARWQYLTPSETTTVCPYKGMANYYNISIDGKVYEDLIWWYKYPTAESAGIAGHMCFYNEKVKILIDDVEEEA